MGGDFLLAMQKLFEAFIEAPVIFIIAMLVGSFVALRYAFYGIFGI